MRYYEPTIGLQLFLAGSTVMVGGLIATIATVTALAAVTKHATHEVATTVTKLIASSDQPQIP